METLKKHSKRFVIVPAIKKHPIGNYKEITKTDWEKVKKSEMLAILTGSKSNLTVIDLDRVKKEDGKIKSYSGVELYIELIKKYNNGKDINTLTARSPSTGGHLYFNYVKGLKSFVGLQYKEKMYGVDCRNENQNIICPPSINNDPNYEFKGIKYKFINPEAKIIDMPKWLFNFINKCQVEKKISHKISSKVKRVREINNNEIYFLVPEQLLYLLKELSDKYKNNYDEWLIACSCMKSTGLDYAWDIFDKYSKTGDDYDYEDNKQIWNLLHSKLNLNYILNILNYDFLIQPTLKYKPFNYIFDEKYYKNPEENIKIKYSMCNVEHIAEKDKNILDILKFYNIDKFDTWIIKSCQSSGKTTSAAQFYKIILKKEKLKLLSIISRRTLEKTHIPAFKKYGITIDSYLNKNNCVKSSAELNKINNLVIQVDSLPKLNKTNFSDCVVYFDEINSMTKYAMKSETLKSRRIDVINKLGSIIKTAKYIIGTDADISDLVTNFIAPLRKKSKLILNKYQNYKNIRVTHHFDETKIIDTMRELIKNDEYFIACFDSKKYLKLIYEMVYDEKKKDKFVVYTSDEGPEINDVNTEWHHKWIFYSPAIEYGLDFWTKKPIKVFSFMKCRSITPLECIQQITRARNIDEIHYYIENRCNQLLFHDVKEVEEYYNQNIKQYEKVLKEYNGIITRNFENIIDNENIVVQLFYQSEFYDRLFFSNFHYHFYTLMKEKGFKIKSCGQPKKITSKTMMDLIESIDIKDKKIIDNILSSSVNDENKKLYNNVMAFCKKYLNVVSIDDIKKFKNIVFSESNRQCHFSICNYLKKELYLVQKQKRKTVKELSVHLYKENIPKMLLLKKFEKILNIKPFELNVKKDDLDKKVVMNDDFWNQLSKLFGISKKVIKPKKLSKGIKHLKNCYRKLLGKDIIVTKSKVVTKNKKSKRTTKYILNEKLIKKHLELYEFKDNTYKNFDDYFIKKFELVKIESNHVIGIKDMVDTDDD